MDRLKGKTAVRNSKTKARANRPSALDRVMKIALKAGKSLGFTFRNNAKRTEIFFRGGGRKVKSVRPTRKRKALAA